MPKIVIDGQTIECRPGISVLQAALEAGLAVPFYCYHPGLKVVASCRLCLMEMKMPHPKTHEMAWAPKLFPSCQTPAKDGTEVRFDSDAVRSNVRHVMEYYLLNHPLDCPVCDKAGECLLQDYTEAYGSPASRMIEDKQKNPKKDIGPHTLLYQDRCVLCTRCVRFCQEVAGTGELTVVNRGSRGEIDVFPGQPLDNPLQGNVVDICPVGALLDKDFLFKQRVWLLKATPSISPADSRGQAIFIDHNDGRIHRIRPRYSEKVNEWWISDEARFGWKFVQREDRLRYPLVREGDRLRPARWETLGAAVLRGLGRERVAVVLSPFMSCEEAWLLAKAVRNVAPQTTLALGPIPRQGEDRKFPKGFVITAEKCPNRRGVETVIAALGGPTAEFRALLGQAAEGSFAAAYVVGGHPEPWATPDIAAALAKVKFLVVHDLFPAALTEHAAVVVPGVSWAERSGTFMNCDGLVQPFEAALLPLEGTQADGQFFYELSGQRGLFRAADVRAAAAREIPAFAETYTPRPEPKHAH